MKRIDKALELHEKLNKIKDELEEVIKDMRDIDIKTEAYDIMQAKSAVEKAVDRLRERIQEVISWFEEVEKREEGGGGEQGTQ